MPRRRRRRRWSDYPVFMTLRLVVAFAQALTIEQASGLARFFAWLAYHVDRRHRAVGLENLATGKSKEERRRKAAGTYATMLGALFVARALGDAEGEKYLADVRRYLASSS